MPTYKVVSFTGATGGGLLSAPVGTVAEQLAAAISANSGDGWRFHSLTKVDIEQRPGCLGALLGKTANYTTLDHLVFEKLDGL